jgi:hypothetical protein
MGQGLSCCDPQVGATGSRQPCPPPTGVGAGLALARRRPRGDLPFRAVNLPDAPDYDPGLQRHHLLPRQLLQKRCFGPLFDLLGRERIGFEDFRTNGLLLPASTSAALRIGLPMHRGPHHSYNAMVIERVGQVEAGWNAMRLRAPDMALTEAVGRLRLLQRALRRRLLDPRRRRLTLNRHDPLDHAPDFSELDAMADSLWGDTQAMEPGGMALPSAEELLLILRPAGRPPPGDGAAFRF